MMRNCIYVPAVCFVAALFMVVQPDRAAGKDWNIPADSVELTDGDLDRPYQIKQLISFKIKGKKAEDAANQARADLRKIAADRKCDAVIFVDHFVERDPTELFTNALVVQSLDSAEAAERRKNYKSPDDVREKVEKREIMLRTGDIPYPYEIVWIGDVLSPDGAAATVTTVDGQLSDLARAKRGHAVVFVEYSRTGTQVNGAKGVIVKFPRKWLKTGQLD